MGKGREKRRRRQRRQARGKPPPEPNAAVVRIETRDPRTRWRNTTARGTPVQFESTGVQVPVDVDSEDAPLELVAQTLNPHFRGGG